LLVITNRNRLIGNLSGKTGHKENGGFAIYKLDLSFKNNVDIE